MQPDLTQNSNIKPDVGIAEQFLTLLHEEGSFIFEIIEEPKPKEHKASIKRYYGTFEQHRDALVNANKNGYGVFFVVNLTNDSQRCAANVIRVRALFVDLDGSPLGSIYEAPLEPHIIIESSPGRYHVYWLVEDVSLMHFESLQKFLAQRFKGDPSVCDLPRLMRLPGFYHRKGVPHQSCVLQTTNTIPYSFQKFQQAFNWHPEEQASFHASSNIHQPVLVRLQELNLLKVEEDLETGRWRIRCPWAHEHTDGSEDAYVYAKSSKKYPKGGFHCFHGHCQSRDLRALRFFLGFPPLEGIEPLPLFREVPPSSRFPIEALGPVLGQAAKELYETVKAPLAVIAQSLLGAASLVTQGHANIETADGRCVALSLFLITVAESGERKSSIDEVVLSAVLEWQAMLCAVSRKEQQQYEDKLEIWTEAKKKARSNSVLLAEIGPEPVQPLMPYIVIEEPTYEGLVKYLEHGQPSVGIFSDEGARFLGGNAMNRENMLKTLAGLSSLWDAKKNKPITRMRSGDKSLALYGRRCALHLMIQESVYGQLNEHSICNTQGFLPRCLVSFPESMAGTRMYTACNPRELPGVRTFGEHCNALLDRSYPQASPSAPSNQLEIPSIKLSHEAHEHYVRFHDNCERQLGKDSKYYSVRRFGSKASEHLLRIAGVLALFENPSIKEVTVDYIERAITIMEYYLEEQLRLDSYYCVDPTLLTAQKVLDWAQRKEQQGVKLSELYQYGPSEVRSKDKAMQILLKLEAHGRAFPIPAHELEENSKGKAWRFIWPKDR